LPLRGARCVPDSAMLGIKAQNNLHAKATIEMLTPTDVFPRSLTAALLARGQYVYAYYEPGSFVPFYVGKGSGNRALAHWKMALQSPKKDHEKRIAEILKSGASPHICLLAYNLDSSTEDRHSIAERVLQDAFGIQSVVEKAPGGDRIADKKAVLLQKREDSAKRRPLSLDAVVAMHSSRTTWQRSDLRTLACEQSASVLLVGLMETYQTAHQDCHLREMARMYWKLEKFEKTSLDGIKKKNSILIAWSSKLTGHPVIVGAWRIDGTKAIYHEKYNRYEFPASGDVELRRTLLGRRLEGTGSHWQGQSIFAPSNENV
jgi:hypothetical protein